MAIFMVPFARKRASHFIFSQDRTEVLLATETYSELKKLATMCCSVDQAT
jgi:hypothetical protein